MVGYGGKDLQKRKVLSMEWKSERVMDDESGESMELMEEVPLKELGESESKWLVRGWRREAGSWFQRRGEAYWKERSVIRREDDVDGRASVTKECCEEAELWWGYTDIKVVWLWELCRYVRGACIRIKNAQTSVKIGHVVSEKGSRTDRQTDKQIRSSQYSAVLPRAKQTVFHTNLLIIS